MGMQHTRVSVVGLVIEDASRAQCSSTLYARTLSVLLLLRATTGVEKRRGKEMYKAEGAMGRLFWTMEAQ